MTTSLVPSRTATLRLILSMSAELPVPKGVEFGEDEYLTITFDTAYDLLAWVEHTGGNERQFRRLSKDGALLTTYYTGLWHGRGMSFWAYEPAPLVEVTDEPTPAPQVWDDSVLPGGFVCSVCRVPVESEPCAEHGEKAGEQR